MTTIPKTDFYKLSAADRPSQLAQPKPLPATVSEAIKPNGTHTPSNLADKKITYGPFIAFIISFFLMLAKLFSRSSEAEKAPAFNDKLSENNPQKSPPQNPYTRQKRKKSDSKLPQDSNKKTSHAKAELPKPKSSVEVQIVETFNVKRTEKKAEEAFQKSLIKPVQLPPEKPAITLSPRQKVSDELAKIAMELMAGKLVLDRQEIFKQYPLLEANLTNLSDLSKQFEIMLSRVWIEKALNNLSDYQGTSFEKNILNNLGYNVSSYDDKEFLRDAMKVAFLMPEPPKLEELPKAFKKQAFDIRAMSAGVPAEALSNLRKLLIFCRQNVEELSKQATQNRDALNVDCTSSKGKDIVKDLFHKCNLKLIYQQVKTYLENPLLRSQLSKSDQFLESLPPLSVKLNTEMNETIKEVAGWFKKYEGMIISGFSQGEDDESLKEGVCLALSHRMATTTLNTPDASIDKIAITSIEPTDRMLQAYHLTRNGKTFGSTLLPTEVLAKNGQKENLIFTAKGEIGVGVGLIKHLSHLEESNGAIYLGWGGHATFMRFDPKRKQFFFFDPNLCTIQFKRSSGESLENLATRMTVAYLELYRWAYPTRDHMHARQFVPLKSGEALPIGKIDLSKVPNYT